jgi:predicted glutamine amidotransferase
MCKKLFLTACVVLFCVTIYPASASACRLYAIMGEILPDGVLDAQLVTDPYSLKALCGLGNVDGWGMGYFPVKGGEPVIVRSKTRANADPGYSGLVRELDASKPYILLAHIRWCSSGCCEHGKDSIDDPHPFLRMQDGRRWMFIQNGGVDIARMKRLTGEEYLKAHPPTGSGIDACSGKVVDSELYFIYLLKNIEECGGDVERGISTAITSMVKDGENNSLNFILSDGKCMWAFKRKALGITNRIISLYMPFSLYYLSGPGYSAVASRYPSKEQGNWIAMQDYDLAVFIDGKLLKKTNLKSNR